MTAIIGQYDLGRSLPGYDVLGIILTCEIERLKRTGESIVFHVKPGPHEGFMAGRLPPEATPDRIALRDRVMLPMMRLLPSCRNIINGGDDVPDEVKCKTADSLPSMLAAFRNGVYPLRTQRLQSSVAYATITLREAAYWPTRNSNVPEWLKVAEGLARMGLKPIFVRDTAKAQEPLPFDIAPQAPFDLQARASLYAGAQLNLFVNNGPAWLSLALGAPTLIAKMVAAAAGRCVTPEYFAGVGLPVGSQIDLARPDHRLLWNDDLAEPIIATASEMLNCK